MSRDQYDHLRRLVGRREGGIRLRDLGAAYIEAELLGPEGQVVDHWRLPTIKAAMTAQSLRRWKEDLKAQDDAERA